MLGAGHQRTLGIAPNRTGAVTTFTHHFWRANAGQPDLVTVDPRGTSRAPAGNRAGMRARQAVLAAVWRISGDTGAVLTVPRACVFLPEELLSGELGRLLVPAGAGRCHQRVGGGGDEREAGVPVARRQDRTCWCPSQ